MQIKYLFNTFLFVLCIGSVSAQNRIEVTPTYRFTDGIYLTFEEFQSNQPALSWSQFTRRSVVNPQTLIAQVDFIRYKNSQESLDLDKIWGICIDGLPFIRIPKDSIHKQLPTFAGLRLAGNVCYFSYENRVNKEYEFAAYNPLNGEPFRKATVSRSVSVFVEKIFSFSDGKIINFDRSSLRFKMLDDPELSKVLDQLRPVEDEYKEKLFRLLMSYNRRHPVYFR